MKEFTKSDLKTGMIVRFRNRVNAILIGDGFKNSNQIDRSWGCATLEDYNEELENENDEEKDIMEVYYIKSTNEEYDLRHMISDLPKEHMKLIWKRKEFIREIDWFKVPKWTKVLVRNDKDDKWKKAYFLGTSPLGFDTTFSDKFTLNDDHIRIWQYIKLYDENDMKEEWCK